MQLPGLGLIHDHYLALDGTAHASFGASLGGRLLLRAPLDADGLAIAVAAGVAGAACLCLDGNPDRLRDALRHGLCDFVVADLSEALRILKNELRRRRAVSVSVTAAPEDCLEEMLERGVQPDLLSLALAGLAASFAERGAVTIPALSPAADTSLLSWSAVSAGALAAAALAASESLQEARPDTRARRHWLSASPRHLGRAFRGRQCLRMTDAEVARFETRALAEIPGVSIERDAGR